MGNRYRYYDEYEQVSGPPRLFIDQDASLSGRLDVGQGRGNDPATGIKLRHAVISDSSFIGVLSRDVFKVYGPYDDILLGWFKSNRDVTTIIAYLDKTRIGFAMLSEPSDMYDLHDVSELLGIAVRPESQGKGIGDLLLHAVERRSASLNIQWIFLHTAVDNITARRLYEKSGYINLEIKKDFYPEGQDAVVMCKAVRRIFNE